MRFFKLLTIVLLKICATDKFFSKICLKIIRDIFFSSNMWSVEGQGRNRGTQSFGMEWYPTEGEASNLWTCRETPPPPSHQFPSLVEHPDLSISKTLRRVLHLFTAMILKRVSKGIYFQRNKFTTCKVKDGKEAANSLMAFNLPKIIHPFQGKKHLRT